MKVTFYGGPVNGQRIDVPTPLPDSYEVVEPRFDPFDLDASDRPVSMTRYQLTRSFLLGQMAYATDDVLFEIEEWLELVQGRRPR